MEEGKLDVAMIEANIAKMMAETMKLVDEGAKLRAETAKLQRDVRWYPVIWATAFVGAVLGVAELLR
ncbi:hypothetical protein C9I57_25010 [Trinickia symbiotica]|uniref:Uncharacterized protein n=1 Tax=Trinickia symbiotica TaxID=863227 RepID=A0A2T3XNJ3_9BURK|nr:hypothetical protein [Trinickia symbiotica]PTB18092.1 hypothetical protein C9I57_25010 [Trinickia symbiotica]